MPSDAGALAGVRANNQIRRLVLGSCALASYERKRLIEQKVPFLVPGNQLYLPDLGINLREYFRKPPVAPDTALSPATQAMLIIVLLRKPWRAEWQPAEVVNELGYTAMTLSLAVKELTGAGIETLPEPLPGACEWELWHYDSALIHESETVDPLSLTLSLQGSTDERVQLALDELKGRFPW